MLIAVGKEECYEAQLELYQRVNLAYRMRQTGKSVTHDSGMIIQLQNMALHCLAYTENLCMRFADVS